MHVSVSTQQVCKGRAVLGSGEGYGCSSYGNRSTPYLSHIQKQHSGSIYITSNQCLIAPAAFSGTSSVVTTQVHGRGTHTEFKHV